MGGCRWKIVKINDFFSLGSCGGSKRRFRHSPSRLTGWGSTITMSFSPEYPGELCVYTDNRWIVRSTMDLGS